MEAQLLDFDYEAYETDSTHPYTGYTKADFKQSQVKVKERLYNKQHQELVKLLEDLWLAYQVAGTISNADALYYLQMYLWVCGRYNYLIDYSFNSLLNSSKSF